MATPTYVRSLASSVKRLKLSPSTSITIPTPQTRLIQTSSSHSTTPSTPPPLSPNLERQLATLRLPKAVQATYLAPLRHPPTRAPTKSCILHLRSYSVRNLELYTDFAQRAAYFLQLPASGAKPLPRLVQRWTVPRSNFVHKKSQENFERVTLRRQLRVDDGNPRAVALWLAFLRKHQHYGVGMKAEVFEYGRLEAGEDLEAEAAEIGKLLGEVSIAGPKAKMHGEGKAEKVVLDEPFKGSWGAYAPSGGAQSVPSAGRRIPRRSVKGGE